MAYAAATEPVSPVADKISASPGKITVQDLVALFEDSEDSTLDARKLAERDRDYVDNKQLTSAQRATLKKRGQPDDIFNHIKKRVNFLVGLEKSQKVDPQALPNTPMHEEDAAGATMALRYVAEAEDFDSKRSAVWRNMLVEGAGGMDVRIEEGYDGPYVCLQRIAWDRMFTDPHSAEHDYSDASYLGTVTWMDYDDALIQYPDGKEILDATLSTTNPRDTYDDKPKHAVWADRKRRRIRIVQIWLKKGETWHWAEFTKGGILKGGQSPYLTDKGESDCALIFQSAYVDRDNNRYGDVRELIGPQNSINKGRQKAMHLLNTAQVIARKGAVDDAETARREAARPDGWIEVNGSPNNPLLHDFQFNTRSDLAASHVTLMQEARNEMEVMGPNATMLGDKTGGSSSASGKAIIASQQGGLMQLSDLLDNLRHFDKRVFRAIWSRIRQSWTGEKWVRVTDDERNMKWVGVNVDPMQLQMMQMQNPQMQEQMAGSISNVAELDCDITIEDAPDTLTPQLEQFQALVELKQYDVRGELPFRALIAAAPNLRNKEKIFEEMDKGGEQQAQMQQQQMQLQMAELAAKVKDLEAASQLKTAQAMKTQSEIGQVEGAPMSPETQEDPAKTFADITALHAKARDSEAAAHLKQAQRGHTEAQTQKTNVETTAALQDLQMRPVEMQREQYDAERDREQQRTEFERNAKIAEMKARQKPTRAA